MKIIDDKVREIAAKHASIIESECKKACEKFNCDSSELIIEYQGHLDIRITVKASHFRITNNFTYDSDQIKINAIHQFDEIK